MADNRKAKIADLNEELLENIHNIGHAGSVAARLELFEVKQELVKVEQHLQRIQAMVIQEASKPAKSDPDANPMPEGSWGSYNKQS
jgi:hypothetical protein